MEPVACGRMRSHDLIIIGAGSGNSIIGPEHDDMDVAIIERGLFGGTCLNVGCIPSKMLVYAAEIAELAGDVGPQLGLHTTFDGADWPAIRDRVFNRIDPIASGGESYRKGLSNVTVYQDSAVFVGPKEIQVGDQTITADKIVIAAGARSWIPPIDGLETVGYQTSDTIMRLDEMPKRLAVIGGGYIATELGNVFGLLGSNVTFLLRSDRMLRNEDETISATFTGRTESSTSARTGIARFARWRRHRARPLPNHDDRVDEILVATGRIPDGDDSSSPSTATNSTLPGISSPTHSCGQRRRRLCARRHHQPGAAQARRQPRGAGSSAQSRPSRLDDRGNHRFVPHAVFGHPQVASVGMTERDAAVSGHVHRPFRNTSARTAGPWRTRPAS